MKYQEAIEHLKGLLEDCGYEKYCRDLARILYRYLKNNDGVKEMDLKVVLETICSELDWNMTKKEILRRFEELVRERISFNNANNNDPNMSERDFLIFNRDQLLQLIEDIKREYERTKDQSLLEQLKKYERELKKIEARLKDLERKEMIKELKRRAKEKAKKESKKEKTATKKEVRKEDCENSYPSQDYYILLARLEDLYREIRDLRKRIEAIEREPSQSEISTEIKELKDSIETLKKEYLTLVEVVSKMGKSESESKEEKVERRKGGRKRKWLRWLGIGVLIAFISPILIYAIFIFLLLLPIILPFLIPYLIIFMLRHRKRGGRE